MLKLPAIGTILSEAIHTFKRFPGVLICTISGAFALSYQLNVANDEEFNWLIYFIFTCSLGAVSFFNAYLYFERNATSYRDKWLYTGLIVIALVIYFVLQPYDINRISIVRFVLLSLGLHLLVSIIAFINREEPNGFWHFNQRIFIRLVIALLYSLVLFSGAALALITIDYLFEVNFVFNNYLRTFYFIFVIFNSWIFLNGVPDKISELEKDESFPKLLKYFSQFVLLPLVSVYIIILYVYAIRLFILGESPETNVAYMVLALAMTGILALLLVWPMNKLENYGWLRIFQKVFYIILIPLIFLFFIAIWQRVRDYGITENRYFILVLALWLFGIALYFIFSKKQKIKAIPTSLCIIVFLSSFGPWGAIKVSRVSQLLRFETILSNNNLLQNGKATVLKGEIDNEEIQQLNSVTDYIIDVFGLNELQPYFNLNLDSLSRSSSIYENDKKSVIFDQLQVKLPEVNSLKGNNFDFHLSSNNISPLRVNGFKELFQIQIYESDADSFSTVLNYEDKELKLQINLNPARITIMVNNIQDLEFEINDQLMELIRSDSIDRDRINIEKLSYFKSGKKLKYKFNIINIDGRIEKNEINRIYGLRAFLLVSDQ